MDGSQDRKDLTLRYIRLGMSRNDAFILARVPLDEQVEFERDPLFMEKCEVALLQEEYELLDTLDDIIADNAAKGTSTEIRWKLERINPKRWGKRLTVDGEANTPSRQEVDVSHLPEEQKAALLDAVTDLLTGGAA